jgi:hypothetical protein
MRRPSRRLVIDRTTQMVIELRHRSDGLPSRGVDPLGPLGATPTALRKGVREFVEQAASLPLPRHRYSDDGQASSLPHDASPPSPGGSIPGLSHAEPWAWHPEIANRIAGVQWHPMRPTSPSWTVPCSIVVRVGRFCRALLCGGRLLGGGRGLFRWRPPRSLGEPADEHSRMLDDFVETDGQRL